MRKRRTSDFDIPGKLRHVEHNPRGKKAEWISFAVTKPEMDEIMMAIGAKVLITNGKNFPAGMILAEICQE